jgi:hypothetical protein
VLQTGHDVRGKLAAISHDEIITLEAADGRELCVRLDAVIRCTADRMAVDPGHIGL